MIQDRFDVVLYPASVCNLNCRYCAIDKNPALSEIDKKLEESFKGDYYINFIKRIFPDPNQLKRLETWGGEPFLGMERIHRTLRQIIEYYPNYEEFFSSTNMLAPNFHQKLYDLFKIFGEYPNRHFKVSIQLSLDGPKWITDESRGKGVTDKIHKSIIFLHDTILDNVPKNIEASFHFKPTLDSWSLKELNSKEKIIEYYQFFESYYCMWDDIVEKANNVNLFPTVPNTASPGQHTVEEGKMFAQFVKNCVEIEEENKNTGKYFKHYQDNITPYRRPAVTMDNIQCDGGTCGSCKYVLGLLPDNMISGCHTAFVDLLDSYKKSIKFDSYKDKVIDLGTFDKDIFNFFIFKESELPIREEQIEYYYKKGTSARLVSAKAFIQTIAYTGQIDSCFISDEEALKAAEFITQRCSYCFRDNLGANGTLTMPNIGLIRLLLNGAYKYISEEKYSV